MTDSTGNKFISTTSEWSFELIERYNQELGRIAADYKLETYPNQIEIITAEQMLDAYSSAGMPLGYSHWSYGKHFISAEQNYKRGHMGLAYEIVINSNPCIAYLMEENTILMQALVIAHACYGHNSFFKNNFLFRSWTNADSIIDYLLFAKNYISDCERRHGVERVESVLDSCHALMNYGVDRYRRPPKLSLKREQDRMQEREKYLQSQVNDLWRTLPTAANKEILSKKNERFPAEPQENILYFFEKHAPLLEPWEREVIRIVRKISQYFYPQRQTQVMNEGWATFWHYTLINRLFDEGLITDGYMLEFLQSHTNVIAQPGFDSPYYSGINPYALGFAIMSDIRRVCEHPTPEDKIWFPDFAGSNWLETLDFAMRNFKDESFISQFLSPKVIRDMHLFSVLDDDTEKDLKITAIHNDEGYRRVRQTLVDHYNLSSREPNIQIYNANLRGNRALTLRHTQCNRMPLAGTVNEMLKHVTYLWRFDAKLETVDPKSNVLDTYDCPANS